MYSAGFVAHRDDDMTMLRLTESYYVWLAEEIKRIAEKYALEHSALECGYELHAL